MTDSPQNLSGTPLAQEKPDTLTITPPAEGSVTELPSTLRSDYAHALVTGQTKGPQDFADAHLAAAQQVHADLSLPPDKGPLAEIPKGGLAPHLPSNADFTDHAIAVLRTNDQPVTPDTVAITKQNLARAWAATGVPPAEQFDKATKDPALAATLVQPRPAPSTVSDTTLKIIENIESNGRNLPANSVGAVGPMQIIPKYFPQFDAARLASDPDYNRAAGREILQEYSNRYGGDIHAMAVAYNAGPRRADNWILSGRDRSTLPAETQNYLAKIDRMHPDMVALSQPGRDKIFDPITADSTSSAPITLKPGGLASKAADYFAEVATKDFNTIKNFSFQDMWDGLKQAHQEAVDENAGKTLLDRVTDKDGLNTAIGVSMMLGVGPIAKIGDGFATLLETAAQTAARHAKAEGKEIAQATIVKETGLAARDTAAVSAQLEEYRKTVNKGMADYQSWLNLKRNNPPGAPLIDPNTGLPIQKPAIQQLIDHIEGVPGAALDPKSELFPVATVLRSTYQAMRKEIETTIPDLGSFIDDYYRHMWEHPTTDDTILGVGKQGDSASLNLRVIPTISEGINQGLIPKIADPLENTIHYVQGMRNFLASKRIQDAGKELGQIEYSASGPPQPGWKPLKGAGAEAAVGPGIITRAYANPGYANAYNTWIGKGWYDWHIGNLEVGPIMDKVQMVSNAMVGAKLALSGFHMWNIGQESVTAGIGRAFGKLSHGDLTGTLGEFLRLPIAPALDIKAGREFQRQYLGLQDYGPDMEKLADLFAKSGGRGAGNRGLEYGGNQSVNYVQAFRRGNLTSRMFEGVTRPEGEPLAKSIAMAPLRAGGAIVKEAGNLNSTLMAPLFDVAIPKIKMSAWADEMSDWIKQNPLANEAGMIEQGRKLQRSMDDRFGEMVQDNLFWPKALKQMLNLMTVSVGWEYGSLRAFGGAAKDILNGDVLSPRARWALAFPATMALQSAAYQYLKTGQTPQGIQDLVGPRTGGEYTVGKTTVPERALLPGYEKDALQWYNAMVNAPDMFDRVHGVAKIANAKANPMVQSVEALLTGQNWAGKDIRGLYPNPDKSLPPAWLSYLKNFADELKPISQMNTQLKGSNIGTGEHLFGLRPVGGFVQDPKAYADMMNAVTGRQIKDAEGFAIHMNQRLAEPNPDIAGGSAPIPPAVTGGAPAPKANPRPPSKAKSNLNPNYGTGRLAPLPGQAPEEAPLAPMTGMGHRK